MPSLMRQRQAHHRKIEPWNVFPRCISPSFCKIISHGIHEVEQQLCGPPLMIFEALQLQYDTFHLWTSSHSYRSDGIPGSANDYFNATCASS
jgi:hypothetical protein